MPYTPSYVPISGDNVDAGGMQDNNNLIRRYINRTIAPNDFKKGGVDLTTQEIARGEYFGVTTDHQFTSGDLYTQVVDAEIFNRSYMSSHWKQTDLLSQKWQVIPNSGKKVTPELDSYAIYTVSVSLVGCPNYQLEAQKLLNNLYVYVDDSDVLDAVNMDPTTYGGGFTEDWTSADGSGSGWTANNGFGARRWYCVRKLLTLSQGKRYNVGLGVNTNCDKLYISAINANIELFYKANSISAPGYEPEPPTNPIPT